MTIKQNGGVFGRNPTFNDVTIEGQLTFDGDIDINSDLKVNGDLDVVGDITAGNEASLKTVISEYSMEVGGQYGKMVGTKTGSGVGGLEFYSYYGGLYKTADLTSSGHLNLTTGNLIVSSGAGIDFSATAGTGTSELLDDYEEGVHTTAATCTTSGTIGFVSSNNQLAYTKTGNTVHVSGYLYVNAVSSPVGGVQISLPFTAADLADSGGASVASLYLTNVVAENVSDFVGKIDEGNDFLLMYLGNSNSVQTDSAQQIQAGSQIYISITYKTA